MVQILGDGTKSVWEAVLDEGDVTLLNVDLVCARHGANALPAVSRRAFLTAL